MDLTTRWLGHTLAHPLVVGASPLVDDLDVVRRLVDAGAAAIGMHSLFEEQIDAEHGASVFHADQHHFAHAEAQTYLPDPPDYALGPRAYLEQLRRIKAAVPVPVVASLNGTTPHGWTTYARRIEEAGADALELNVYFLATRAEIDARGVEDRLIEVAHTVRHVVRIPLAVKLSPFFSSLPHLVQRLADAGVDAVVLFNRFYQPDIDVEQLENVPKLSLSDSSELLLRLRWLAILHGRVGVQLAASGGVHTPVDVVKALLAGADTVQVVSALLRNGPEHLRLLRQGLEQWLQEHGYASVSELRGTMSLARCPDPEAYERGNYAKILQTWKVGDAAR